MIVDAEEKPTHPNIMKQQDASTAGYQRNSMSSSGSFASHGDPIMPSNVYIPHPPAYFYGGYDNSFPEWDEYSSYFNAEGMDLRSPGMFNDNPSVMYHPGYGYNAQIPYGPYPPASSSLDGDAQLYSQQHFPFSGPTFYPNPGPAPVPFVSSPSPVLQTDVNLVPSMNQEGDNIIIGPRPSYHTPVGSFGRGRGSGGPPDLLHNFDGAWSGGLWSEWPKPSDSHGSMTTYSPAVSPQPFGGTFGLYGPSLGHAHHSQRTPHYGSGSTSHSFGRGYAPACVNQGYLGSAPAASFESNRGWHSLNNLKPRGRGSVSLCGCNNIDIFNEQNRGPRASKSRNQDTGDFVSPDDDNPTKSNFKFLEEFRKKSDFGTDYEDAKFFIIKSYSEDNVHKSIKYGVWASTPNGNKRLDAAYHDAKDKQEPCPVFLFFSVNASGQFCGVAEMVGAVDFDNNVEYWQQDKWTGQFPVKWHIIKDVPNSHFRHILLENNDGKPVTNSRDTQEVKLEQGLEMLKIFKNYETDMSILYDFSFYEARQKAMLDQKAKQMTAAVVVRAAEPGRAGAFSNDFIKQMSKSFAQAVRVDESRNEAKSSETGGSCLDSQVEGRGLVLPSS